MCFACPCEGSPCGNSIPRQNALVPTRHALCSASSSRITPLSRNSWRLPSLLPSFWISIQTAGRLLLPACKQRIQASTCKFASNNTSLCLGLLEPGLLLIHPLHNFLHGFCVSVFVQLAHFLVGRLHLLREFEQLLR